LPWSLNTVSYLFESKDLNFVKIRLGKVEKKHPGQFAREGENLSYWGMPEFTKVVSP